MGLFPSKDGTGEIYLWLSVRKEAESKRQLKMNDVV
jgi:hypothetical protein